MGGVLSLMLFLSLMAVSLIAIKPENHDTQSRTQMVDEARPVAQQAYDNF